MPEALKNIAIGARSQSRFFIMALCRSLKQDYGACLHLYCANAQEVEFYQKQNQDGVFESIIDAGIILSRCFATGLDEREVFARAAVVEQRIGMTINRMMVPDRHLGRGYCLGGFYHPRSRYSENTSYVQAVNAYCDEIEFWQREFWTKKITLCINGSREAARTARSLGIPYRVLIGSRFRNYHNWAHNEYYENPEIERRWGQIEDAGDVEMDAPYHGHIASRAKYQKAFSFKTLCHSIGLTTARYAYWNLRGYKKAKGYYYLDTICHSLRMWAEYRKLRKLGGVTLGDMKGKRFVYFPLHVEPETALHGISPEYFYQHALIAAVSRDLPAGVYLAVKEAYGSIGRRPANFYRQIADLKNVVLLDCWEQGLQCARGASAVVTICGTVGLEAAVAGVPVISFGKHNLYNFLPSVKVVENEQHLPSFLSDALSNPDLPAMLKDEGRRLLRAIMDCSFDMEGYDYIRLTQFEQSAVAAASQALVDSISDKDQAAAKGLEKQEA